MATFKDPDLCFAPLELIERLLQIRSEFGYSETLYLFETEHITELLDSFGFDSYALGSSDGLISYGDYSSPIVPRGGADGFTGTAH